MKRTILLALALSVSVLWVLSGADGPRPRRVFVDRFEGKLGEGWTWIRENPDAWRFREGRLEIRVEPGVAHTVKNALVREAPDRSKGRFAIDVTVENTVRPTNQFEQAGITWYVKGQPVCKFVKEFIDGELYVFPGKVPMESDKVQLRLIVSADSYVAQFRPDARGEFRTAAEGKLPPPSEDQVSIQCYNGPADAEHWIRFDDFRILDLSGVSGDAPAGREARRRAPRKETSPSKETSPAKESGPAKESEPGKEAAPKDAPPQESASEKPLAKRPSKIVIADPAEAAADPDFAVQGEYVGDIAEDDGGTARYGVQVIARGGGAFQAVAHRGGLPGAGWDGSERTRVSGKTRDGAARFAGEFGEAAIRDGALTVVDPAGKTIGTLRRVQRQSPTLGARPPEGAIVLFDGERNGFKPGETTPDKLLCVPGHDQRSDHVFAKDFKLHLEFRTPYQPNDRGQARGNSGVHLQGRWEIQVLDSFGEEGKADECGSFYGRRAPDVNMCLPPLSWQTYDVDYTVARFDEKGAVVSPPLVTVRHNGVTIHERLALDGGAPPRGGGPLRLQWHDDPLRFRNIWAVE